MDDSGSKRRSVYLGDDADLADALAVALTNERGKPVSVSEAIRVALRKETKRRGINKERA